MMDTAKRVPLVFFRTEAGAEPVREWLLELPLASPRIARVIVCVHEEELYALHAFIKKTRKMPESDLKLARRCKHQLERAK